MFTLKSIVSSIIVIGSLLIQQSTMAYPKASKKLELNFLKASLENIYGELTPEAISFIEQQYDAENFEIDLTLFGGYLVCDGIKQANSQGLDSKTLIETQISEITTTVNQVLELQGQSLTEEQVALMYKTSRIYLCPELD